MPIDIVQRLRDASSQRSTFERLAAEEHYDKLKSEAHDDLARQAQQRFEAALTDVTALLAALIGVRDDYDRLRAGITEIAESHAQDARFFGLDGREAAAIAAAGRASILRGLLASGGAA